MKMSIFSIQPKALLLSLCIAIVCNSQAQTNGSWPSPLPSGWTTSSTTVSGPSVGTCSGINNQMQYAELVGAFVQYTFQPGMQVSSVSFSYITKDYTGTIVLQQLVNGVWQLVQSFTGNDRLNGCQTKITQNIARGATAIRWYQTQRDAADWVALAPNITFSNYLPVTFGALNASLKNNQLSVYWSTLTEKNNDHFNIEVSQDGLNYATQGTVQSEALNGNSDQELKYQYHLTLSAETGLLGFSLLGLGVLALACGRRNRVALMATLVIGSSLFGFTACRKHGKELPGTPTDSHLFIRITQVDKDGQKLTSKVFRPVKE